MNIAAKHGGIADKTFISRLILSSQETGWGDEPGTAKLDLICQGPVRTSVRVRKSLLAGVTYEKIYDFYPDRFDVEISVNKTGSVLSRAFYLMPAMYYDDQGFHAKIDGQGEAEGVSGMQKNPKWYCAYSPDWAQSCIALSPEESICYWDEDALGQIGFTNGSAKNVRMSYVIHAGAHDSSFAADDCNRLTSPMRVVWQ
jgi:hypothetical protein